jgi:hypothetical protein
MWRHWIARLLHFFAAFISAGNLIAILYMHRVSLITGRGLGSFVLPWFMLYFSISVVIWFIAHLLEKNRLWSRIYWITIALAVVIMAVVPIKFYID